MQSDQAGNPRILHQRDKTTEAEYSEVVNGQRRRAILIRSGLYSFQSTCTEDSCFTAIFRPAPDYRITDITIQSFPLK